MSKKENKQTVKQEDNVNKYAGTLIMAIQDLLHDEDSPFYIDQHELRQGDNLTDFIHALANVMPTSLFNNITGKDQNLLEFNQTANQLCFQYYQKDKGGL